MHDMLDNRRYFLFPFTVNMNNQIDGLAGKVRYELNDNPRNGDVFIFFNKFKKTLRMLFWDGDGYCTFTKRMETGRFQAPPGRSDDLGYYITRLQVLQLLRGLQMSTVFQQKNRNYLQNNAHKIMNVTN